MKGLETKDGADELLNLFLSAASEAESESLLARIISEQARPVIKNIIKAKLRVSLASQDGSHLNQDALEIGGDVEGTLIGELQSLKSFPERRTIGNLQSYVAVVTFNACYDYLRRKYPQRHKLKNRLRYLLTHRDDFALWESAGGEWVCGTAARRGQARQRDAETRLQALAQDASALARSGLHGLDPVRLELADLLAILFKELGGPVELDELATAVAHLQGIRDERAGQAAAGDAEEEEPDEVSTLADPRAGVDAEVDRKIYLEKLWAEICELPPRQRAAVLLNLKDAQGNSMIEMLPITGIASVRQIAAALEIPAGEFASLWGELPLDDNAIAARLGLTRQQVINLRKSARDRLARRLRDY
jgi:DNA-directed RNA polymerase specialized sigma24 family protein